MSVADVFHEAIRAILKGKSGRMLSTPRNVYTWLTYLLLNPQTSGRVNMDLLMKLVVTTDLELLYAAARTDVTAHVLEVAAQLLMLTRENIPVIDAPASKQAHKRKHRLRLLFFVPNGEAVLKGVSQK